MRVYLFSWLTERGSPLVPDSLITRHAPCECRESDKAATDVVDPVRGRRTVYGSVRYAVAVVVGGNRDITIRSPMVHPDRAVGAADPPPVTGRWTKDRQVAGVVSIKIRRYINVSASSELHRGEGAISCMPPPYLAGHLFDIRCDLGGSVSVCV